MSVFGLENVRSEDKILCTCDKCGKSKERFKKNILKTRRIFGCDLCQSCSAKASLSKKPQCNSEYWKDSEVKQNHSKAIRSSADYYEAISQRDQSGEKNGMYGKKARIETRKKMSIARTGKLGPQATAWKGGNETLMRRLKRAIQRRYNWFGKVLERTGYSCERCGEKAKDAHHIMPISKLVSSLLFETSFQTDDEKLTWLLEQDVIIDAELKNGLALCRHCHREIHANWGSHQPMVRSRIDLTSS